MEHILVIASKNIHKIREFRAILKNVKHFDLLSLMDFPHYQPLPETGSTFEENAILKAQHAAKELNHLVIADDSGLIVPSLNNAPGIYSQRYAGDNATDKDNRKKLLHEMRNIEDPYRQAYFECWIALTTPEGVTKTAKGISEGYITESEKGGSGFGYDSLFVKHEYGKTFAELTEEIKNRISHRKKAIDKIIPFLQVLAEKECAT